MAGAPPIKSPFRPFPGPPPFPRLPQKWNEGSSRAWAVSLLRVLDQQVNPVGTTVYSASSAYSIPVVTSDTVVLGDPTSASFTATLPPVASNVNKTITVKNIAAVNHVTLSGGGANIDGSATQTITAGNALKVVSDGTAWWIV